MTIADLLALSPGPKVSEGARRLYYSRRWRTLGSDGEWLWGEFTVNGPNPLRPAVHLTTGRFYCTCRSRQRPCSHALSLVMILNNQQERISVSSPPEWALLLRQSAPPPATPSTPWQEDPKLAARLELMGQGVEELEVRLLDIVSRGLADTNALGNDFWLDTAARLTDAKLGGLANRLRATHRQTDLAPERQIRILADLYLAIRAWRKLDRLPPERRDELLQYAGINLKKEQLAQGPPRPDHWLVMGTLEGQEDRLRYRRVWLRGESRKRYALLLDYAFGEQPYERSWPLASSWQGDVRYYPGSYPQRAVFTQPKPGGRPYEGLSGYATFAALLHDYYRALALQPWLPNYPAYLTEVVPLRVDGRPHLIDPEDRIFPLIPASDRAFYTLLAASGGGPISLFTEFDGDALRPLSLFTGSGLVAL